MQLSTALLFFLAMRTHRTDALVSIQSSLTASASTSEDGTLGALAANLMSKMDSNLKRLIASLQFYQSWISASTLNTMINYWHYTGNETYAEETASSLIAQAGPQGDFSGSLSPGNDDALWWGLTCISAAEYRLPKPQVGGNRTDWLELAKKVFQSVISRWQSDMCGPSAGGLGWQIDLAHEGYKYKNAITQGLAFQLAARLAALTRESSYEEWANKLFNTSLDAGLIDKSTHQVKDGVHAPVCSEPADERWSYNVGVFMYGAAVMSSLNSSFGGERDTHWPDHAKGFISAAISDFTRDKVLYEPRCEDSGTCNTDQQTFKSYLARWMGMTATLLPDLMEEVSGVLEASRKAALGSVQASPGKNMASPKWSSPGSGAAQYDDHTATGIGAQLAAVEVLLQASYTMLHR